MVVCGRRTTKTFKKLMALVDDLNISLHYTDKLNIYKAFFSVDEHAVSRSSRQSRRVSWVKVPVYKSPNE